MHWYYVTLEILDSSIHENVVVSFLTESASVHNVAAKIKILTYPGAKVKSLYIRPFEGQIQYPPK